MLPLLSIPSPGDPFLIDQGPVHARWYGLLLAAGVLIAGWIARREFRRRGVDPELAYSIAVWAVPLGLIGARLYHVATDWESFSGNLGDIPAIWKGGLGIYGAVLGGMLGTWIGARRVRLSFWMVADCIAPGLVLAQALGRWGNYFNQELYGKPTDLPWGLEIDNPPPTYQPDETFHPTFLYESLWDLAVFGVLVAFTRRFWRRVPYGAIFALYAALYSLGRIFVERLRIDPADTIAGQRLNVWVALLVFLVAGAAFLVLFRRRRPPTTPAGPTPPRPGAPQPEPEPVAGHVPTRRPEAAIAARQKTQRRKRT